jgi:GTP pyrophosphokinase
MKRDVTGLIMKVKKYAPTADTSILQRAYEFADRHHVDQKRASGDPYISHPVAVSNMLADLKLDIPSIATGLLHDTVEDTNATLEDIEKEFGKEIAYLVNGVTKLSRIELQSKDNKQAENFRKLVLAMAQDIRVLLIKLIDRLHNMRTLHYLPSADSRKRIALETIEIYAPLAERIGMFTVQEQLQDLAFAELNPEAYQTIMQRVADFHEKGQDIVQKVIQGLKETVEEGNIECEVYGREKKPYSIWRKMQRKNVNFEQLSDLFGFRIITSSVADCYQALGLIHSSYLVLPQKFKDYISTPKPNHYKSLHTTVIGPKGIRLEIQIRTKAMQEIADRGVAAHWQYKQGMDSKDGKRFRWLRSLLEILDQASGAEEFMEHTKLEMFQDQVFCFTPKGDVVNLPTGATPIDFAYAVHSDVGNSCKGSKINGRLMPLRTELKSGDQVEIITSKNQQPSPTWEQFVVTGKAQANIRRFIRAQQKEQFARLGRSIFTSELTSEQRKVIEDHTESLFKSHGIHSETEFFSSIGEGKITIRELKNKFFDEPSAEPDIKLSKPRSLSKKSIEIKGLVPGMAIHYAGCCHPLPGDKIIGIITTGKGVTIHTADCETLHKYEDEPHRWLDVSWGETGENHFKGRIFLMLENKSGNLGAIATLIGNSGANITNIRVLRRYNEYFDLLIDVDVTSKSRLLDVIALLRANPIVNSVERH